MPTATAELVSPIRHASRKLVRELGFMRPTLAGTDLSPSMCHCLIEIGDFGVNTIKGLSEALALDEDESKATIRELSTTGHVYSEATNAGPADLILHLTQKGRETLVSINKFAKEQVQKALDATPRESGSIIAQGLLQYAAALETCRTQPVLNPPKTKPRTFQVKPGYRPGILARILEMHMDFYWPVLKFGRPFETEIASDFGDLINRLDSPLNEIWAAVETLPDDQEKILGTIIIDGESMGDPGRLAHLRAFIVDEDARGLGVGRALLAEAVKFVDELGFEDTRLWTLAKLDTARHMYEAHGFVVIFDAERMKWGNLERTLMYSRPRPKVENGSPNSS